MKKSNFKPLFYSAIPWLAFLSIMWILYFADKKYGLHYSTFGIYPRDFTGLKGVFFSPFIHGSFEHLLNNSLPLLILGTALFYFYGKLGLKVALILYFLSGFLVWLSARESFHIGASGIIYAFAGFLFMSGILRREKSLIALSLLVAFLYGGLFWGIFPVKESISWEGHLWGGVAGFVLAWFYRKEGPQRKKFDWEEEEEENEDLLATWEQNQNISTKNPIQKRPKNRFVINYEYKEEGKSS
jgi:membrane associated rhomboid family serine protease